MKYSSKILWTKEIKINGIKIIYINIAFISIFHFQCMSQSNQDSVPQTVLDYGTRIHSDLSEFKGRGKILLANFNFAVVGLDDIPFILYATKKFKLEAIPLEMQENIYQIKRLFIQPSFQYDSLKNDYCQIPVWVKKFTNTGFLKLFRIDINNLSYISALPIKYLELSSIKVQVSSINQITSSIIALKHLKGIVYDSSVPIELIQLLNKTRSDYTFYIDSDKIQMNVFEHELIKDIL